MNYLVIWEGANEAEVRVCSELTGVYQTHREAVEGALRAKRIVRRRWNHVVVASWRVER